MEVSEERLEGMKVRYQDKVCGYDKIRQVWFNMLHV